MRLPTLSEELDAITHNYDYGKAKRKKKDNTWEYTMAGTY